MSVMTRQRSVLVWKAQASETMKRLCTRARMRFSTIAACTRQAHAKDTQLEPVRCRPRTRQAHGVARSGYMPSTRQAHVCVPTGSLPNGASTRQAHTEIMGKTERKMRRKMEEEKGGEEEGGGDRGMDEGTWGQMKGQRDGHRDREGDRGTGKRMEGWTRGQRDGQGDRGMDKGTEGQGRG